MKIQVCQNNIQWSKWDKRFQAVSIWYAKANIQLEFVLKTTNFKDIPVEDRIINGFKSKIIVNQWFYDHICKPAQDQGYDGVIFLMDKGQWQGLPIDAVRTDVLPNFIDIQGGFDEKDKYNFNGVFYTGDKATHIIKHELAHEFYIQQGKQDMTHFWYLSGKPERILDDIRRKDVFSSAFSSLLNLLKKNTPTAILKRNSDDGTQTLGTLIYVNGKNLFECKTLELPWKDNQSNISCIPMGEYLCELRYSPSFKKMLYEIKDVPQRTEILLHGASFYTDLKGCVSVGNQLKDLNGDGKLDVMASQATLQEFMELTGGKPFKLVIL